MSVRILSKKKIIFFFFSLVLLGFVAEGKFIKLEEKDSFKAHLYKHYTLQSPVRLAIGHGDLIYVTDFQKECVAVMKIIQDEIKTIKTIPINGNPLGVAVDNRGWVYVGNASTNKVEVYVPNRKFKHWKYKYSLEGEIKRPNDIAIAANGLIYVVASDEDLVKIYYPDGTFRSSFGGSGYDYGRFNFPTGVALDDNNAEVIVSDFLNKRVLVFDYEGDYQRTIGGGWFSSVVERPQGIAVDEQGRIYVVDPKQACILVFNRAGNLITTFGEYGQNKGQFRIPLDIVIDGDSNILVTSNQNSRVEIFKAVVN